MMIKQERPSILPLLLWCLKSYAVASRVSCMDLEDYWSVSVRAHLMISSISSAYRPQWRWLANTFTKFWLKMKGFLQFWISIRFIQPSLTLQIVWAKILQPSLSNSKEKYDSWQTMLWLTTCLHLQRVTLRPYRTIFWDFSSSNTMRSTRSTIIRRNSSTEPPILCQ